MISDKEGVQFLESDCYPGFSVGADLVTEYETAGFRYNLSNYLLPFNESVSFCQDTESSQIASILSTAEFDIVSKLVRQAEQEQFVNSRMNIWIGLLDKDPNINDPITGTARFVWVDESLLEFGEIASQFPWEKRKPDNALDGHSCVE